MKTSIEAKIRHPRELKSVRRRYYPYLAKFYGHDQLLVDASISEAVWNAWTYGHDKQSHYPIYLNLRFLNTRLIVRISDHGGGFDWRSYHLAGDVKQWFPTLDDLEQSGRGIMLMLRVMDVLRYNDSGNECLLMKNIYFRSRSFVKTNMCRYCYKEIRDRDDLVTASNWFRIRPYHYRCFEKMEQDTKTIAGTWTPINGRVGLITVLLMAVLSGLMLLTDLLGGIGDLLGVLALYPILLRVLSYFVFEMPLPKLADDKRK